MYSIFCKPYLCFEFPWSMFFGIAKPYSCQSLIYSGDMNVLNISCRNLVIFLFYTYFEKNAIIYVVILWCDIQNTTNLFQRGNNKNEISLIWAYFLYLSDSFVYTYGMMIPCIAYLYFNVRFWHGKRGKMCLLGVSWCLFINQIKNHPSFQKLSNGSAL